MGEFRQPGVFVEELNSGPRPIEGVSTSTAGFVGQTERGPITATFVTSWLDYQGWFGGHVATSKGYLPYAVQGFFDNGGQRAFIVRVVGQGTTTSSATISLPPGTDGVGGTLQVRATGPGAWGQNLRIRVDQATQNTEHWYRILIIYYRDGVPTPWIDPIKRENLRDKNRKEPDVVEDYDNLSLDENASNYLVKTINGASRLINVSLSVSRAPSPTPDPTPAAAVPQRQTLVEFDVTTFSPATEPAVQISDYEGDVSAVNDFRGTGLAAIALIDEVSILCVPDEADATLDPIHILTHKAIEQCERTQDRVAVLSVLNGQSEVDQIQPGFDSSYAAIYYPWIRVVNPREQDTLLVPPSGHVAGIYARTDTERGVHKAPANSVVRGIVTADLDGLEGPLEYTVSQAQHDILNPRGINVIRDFRANGRGIRVWGARTISSDPLWRYINMRRLFLFVEESIGKGTQWVVFESNDETTWGQVRRSATSFLVPIWRNGALVGATPHEAFFVKCDRTTMTQDDIDNGRLICLIGIAPVKPAEFVIFRISQMTADAPT